MVNVPFLSFVLLAGIGLSLAYSQEEVAKSKSLSSGQRPIARMSSRSLPNLVRVHSTVFSGGLPAGESGFAELQHLGVQTIVSVDGAKPDVAAAARYGLRYVHLPHGYDGISPSRAAELAKAVRELPAPIYIHCHHGQHRSPAAASVACVGAGLITPREALGVLQIAGTSWQYRGLYQAVRDALLLDQDVLEALKPEFPATAPLPAMAQRMVAIEHIYGNLNALQQAGWSRIPSRPDMTAEHEALLLREQLTELNRADELRQEADAFRQLMAEAETHARTLELAIRQRDPTEGANRDLERAWQKLSNNCQTCHTRFRDVPRSERD